MEKSINISGKSEAVPLSHTFRFRAALVGEDYAGMRSQLSGVAERLNTEGFFIPVRSGGRLRRFCSFLSVAEAAGQINFPPDLDFILSVGGKGGRLGLKLGRRHNLPVFQIQDPRRRRSQYDLILASAHDCLKGANVISLRTALHPLTPKVFEEKRRVWEPRIRQHLAGYPEGPLLGVLLGGPNGRFRMGIAEALKISAKISDFLEQNKGKAIFIRSRRTPEICWQTLQENLKKAPVFFWDGEGADNPYGGILATADVLGVTCDSVSMVSEAVGTTAPVGILELPGRSRKISDFLSLLKQADRIEDFSASMDLARKSPLDEAEIGVQRILDFLEAGTASGKRSLSFRN